MYHFLFLSIFSSLYWFSIWSKLARIPHPFLSYLFHWCGACISHEISSKIYCPVKITIQYLREIISSFCCLNIINQTLFLTQEYARNKVSCGVCADQGPSQYTYILNHIGQSRLAKRWKHSPPQESPGIESRYLHVKGLGYEVSFVNVPTIHCRP